MTATQRHNRSLRGFTTVEILFAASILVLIAVNVSMVMKSSGEAYKTGVLRRVIDDQADLTMDRISFAVMSSSADEIFPVLQAPNSTHRLDYQTILGVTNGNLVLADPERIEHFSGSGSIVWSRNPDTPEALKAVWTQWVPINLEGEKSNGFDDNSNGLVDEPGLSFDSSGPKVNIHLTLERKDKDGQFFRKTVKQTVTCRN